MLKKIKKCLYCGYEYEIKRKKCPAFGETCKNCLKKNHFQAVCKFKKINIERVEEKTIMEVFSVKNKNKNVEKIELKKKDIILKVRINNFLGTHWKADFTKEQFINLSIWSVGHKNFRVLWRFLGVRRWIWSNIYNCHNL